MAKALYEIDGCDFRHAGGNVTGVSFIAVALAEKRLELLRELVDKAALIAVLLNPNSKLLVEAQSTELLAAARTLGAARSHPECQ